MKIVSIYPPEPKTEKLGKPTEEDAKRGYSQAPMYGNSYYTPANRKSVDRRNMRKDIENGC